MKISTALLCLGLSVTAFAESESEFYYQPEESRRDFTSSLVLVSRKAQVRASGLDIESTGSIVALEYDHALSNQFSLGIEISSARQEDDIEGAGGKTESIGLRDIEVRLKGRQAVGEGLRYGGALKFSPRAAEVDSDGDSNQFSGGNSVTPYVGYQWAQEKAFIGVQFSRDFQLGKAELEDESSGTMLEYKLEGGEITSFDVFYEAVLTERVSLGAVLELVKQEDIKISGASTGTLDGKSGSGLVIYVPVTLGNGVLTPRLQVIRMDNELYKDNRIATVGVAYRVEF